MRFCKLLTSSLRLIVPPNSLRSQDAEFQAYSLDISHLVCDRLRASDYNMGEW